MNFSTNFSIPWHPPETKETNAQEPVVCDLCCFNKPPLVPKACPASPFGGCHTVHASCVKIFTTFRPLVANQCHICYLLGTGVPLATPLPSVPQDIEAWKAFWPPFPSQITVCQFSAVGRSSTTSTKSSSTASSSTSASSSGLTDDLTEELLRQHIVPKRRRLSTPSRSEVSPLVGPTFGKICPGLITDRPRVAILNKISDLLPIDGHLLLADVPHPVVLTHVVYYKNRLTWVIRSRILLKRFLSSHIAGVFAHVFENVRDKVQWNGSLGKRRSFNSLFQTYRNAEDYRERKNPVRMKSLLPGDVLTFTGGAEVARAFLTSQCRLFKKRPSKDEPSLVPIPLLELFRFRKDLQNKCEGKECKCHSVVAQVLKDVPAANLTTAVLKHQPSVMDSDRLRPFVEWDKKGLSSTLSLLETGAVAATTTPPPPLDAAVKSEHVQH